MNKITKERTSEIEQEEATHPGDFTSSIFLREFWVSSEGAKNICLYLKVLIELHLSMLTPIFLRISEHVCVSVYVCIHLDDASYL